MKKFISSAFSIAVILAGTVSCNSAKQNQHQSIGGDTDKHGCLKAAGQTWSELQQNCIQVFNVAQRLNPVDNTGSAEISAFVLMGKDNSKAELFLATDNNNKILTKTATNIYQNGIYKYNSKYKALYINNVVKYRADQ